MNSKAIVYSTFAVASLLVILAFVTARSYTQLGIAILLYPALVYFAFKAFPRKTWGPKITIQMPAKPAGKSLISDTDKRDFIKLVGAAGLSFILFSLFNRRTNVLFPERLAGSGTTTPEAERQPLDGYQITEIDDGATSYYGFINKTGGWIIMRIDADTSSFRYSKGESRFSDSWGGREQLKYDYYHNLI